jgi:hypothetical protein
VIQPGPDHRAMRRIRIEYLEVGSQESRLVELPWDSFFDADGMPPIEREYELLKLDPARLVYTVLDVEDGGRGYRIRTQFFAAGGSGLEIGPPARPVWTPTDTVCIRGRSPPGRVTIDA